MSGLTQRVFLMRNVHDDAPVLFQSRWALSYLRGPLTGPEISRLMADARKPQRAPRPAARRRRTSTAARRRSTAPAASSGCHAGRERNSTRLHRPQAQPSTSCLRPPRATAHHLSAHGHGPRQAALHRLEARARSVAHATPISRRCPTTAPRRCGAKPGRARDLKSRLTQDARRNAAFAPLPGAAMRARSYAAWARASRRSSVRERPRRSAGLRLAEGHLRA